MVIEDHDIKRNGLAEKCAVLVLTRGRRARPEKRCRGLLSPDVADNRLARLVPRTQQTSRHLVGHLPLRHQTLEADHAHFAAANAVKFGICQFVTQPIHDVFPQSRVISWLRLP